MTLNKFSSTLLQLLPYLLDKKSRPNRLFFSLSKVIFAMDELSWIVSRCNYAAGSQIQVSNSISGSGGGVFYTALAGCAFDLQNMKAKSIYSHF